MQLKLLHYVTKIITRMQRLTRWGCYSLYKSTDWQLAAVPNQPSIHKQNNMPPKPKARDSRIPDEATLTNLWVANGGGTADGSCEVGLLDTMMRAVPVVLTEKEIADYKTENCGDSITLAEFDACCEFFVEKIGAGVDFGPIFDSFVAYHKSEGGQLTKAQFIQTLSSIGDSVEAK